jgi:hypothetical protein
VSLFPPLCSAFKANEVFNGMIFGVLLIGAGINFLQVLMPMAMRSLLDGIRLRLDESRDISRYMIGLMILGLLETFWEPFDTIVGVGRVIARLPTGAGDLGAVFEELKRN